jgi:tellurite methyltransferase
MIREAAVITDVGIASQVQMATQVAFPWEAEYFTESDESIWGPPSEIYERIMPLLPPGARVLDAGCGDGRHSLLLAENGFEVTAVDISPNAIQKLERLAVKRGLAVESIVEDIVKFEIATDYDLIIAHGLLHLLPKGESLPLLDLFQERTRRGGYNVTVVNTNKIPLPSYADYYMIGLFDEGEVAGDYADWEITARESYEKPASGMISHTRHFNKVAARKR